MKHELAAFRDAVSSGPRGLLSSGDLQRIDAHIEDSLEPLEHLIALDPQRVVDVGSGGGFPAFPLAIALPQTAWALLESQHWKCEFLNSVATDLALQHRLKAYPLRSEDAPHELGREQYDLATARALAHPCVAAELLAPLVRVGGHLALWTTQSLATAQDLTPIGEQLGLGAPQLLPTPNRLRTDGALLLWPKTASTPARFPRRAGVATKRPLGR